MNSVGLIKKFVDIDISNDVSTSTTGSYDTLLIFSTFGTLGYINEVEVGSTLDEVIEALATTDAISVATAITTYSDYSNIISALTVYYNHGGANVIIVTGISDIITLTANYLYELPSNLALIAFVTSDNQANVNSIYSIAYDYNSAHSDGIAQKLFFASTNSVSTSYNECEACVIKYAESENYNYDEFTIPAYLTQLNAHSYNIEQYIYTTETVDATAMTLSLYETLESLNFTFDMLIANKVKAVNTVTLAGNDLYEKFIVMLIQYTLTQAILNVLITKISYMNVVGVLNSVIANELVYYLDSEALSTDVIYTDNDKTVTYNGETYIILPENTVFTKGYFCKILPVTALTTEQRASHIAPPIYLFLAINYSIYSITIEGSVI